MFKNKSSMLYTVSIIMAVSTLRCRYKISGAQLFLEIVLKVYFKTLRKNAFEKYLDSRSLLFPGPTVAIYPESGYNGM